MEFEVVQWVVTGVAAIMPTVCFIVAILDL
jgi:hypothetical protein